MSSSWNHRSAARAAWWLWLAVLVPVSPALAQHAADNPVISAEDAFGATVGLESTGIYNQGSVRGFNPQSAGNSRIDGLYFDQQGPLTNRVIEGSTIRVGVSEIGYAFPAPTGIVDYDLRHATNGVPTATVIAEGGPFDEHSISVDGSVPLFSKELQLPMGANFQTGSAPPSGTNLGYTAKAANLGAAPVWTPNDQVTVRAFADWMDTYQARTLPTVFTAGEFLPPRIDRGFLGQYWALGTYYVENFGALIDAKLTQHWLFAAGIFRSATDNPRTYADLYVNTQPNGSADHVMVAFPDQQVASNSGEARLTGQFTDGSWMHKLVFLVRGRDELSHYGGADAVGVGTAFIGAGAQVAPPDFVYGQRTADHTQLWSAGAAYQVRRPGWGELAFGLQKEQYDKTVHAPGEVQSHLTDDPWRLYAAAARPISGGATAYAGYTQGFEDSGSAPSSAANSGAILPTARTWQIDAGVRYPLTSKLSLIAGLFEVNKPYFNIDIHNVDRALGVQRASGLELSVAGLLAKGLNVNAGALIGHVRVIGPDLAAQGVGSAALGQPSNQALINLDYDLPHVPAVTFDVGVTHFSAVPAGLNDALYVPAVTLLNIGDRYRFKLLGAPATLRLQVQNVLNAYIWNVALSPGFLQFAPRTFVGYITIDL